MDLLGFATFRTATFPAATTLFWTMIVCFGLTGCSSKVDQRDAVVFTEAERLFEEAESLPPSEQKEAFRRVALMYDDLIRRGIKSGPIYFNQGNAWARCDERGRAIVAYRLAQRYMPLDPYIASNLQAQGNLETPTPLIEHFFFWQDWFGVRQKSTGTLILVLLTFLIGSMELFVRHRRVRRLAWSLLALTLISVLSVGYDWYRFEKTRYALVAVEAASPRKGNSEKYDLAFTTPIQFGATATVLDRRGDWVRLRFAADHDGWLPTDQVIEY